MATDEALRTLRAGEYQARLKTTFLRRVVYGAAGHEANPERLPELIAAEQELRAAQASRAEAETQHDAGGLILDTTTSTILLGKESTGLEATMHLRMRQVPTSIWHLLHGSERPLFTCEVRNVGPNPAGAPAAGGVRRIRVTSFVEGYSARAVDTVELKTKSSHAFDQLPTLFPNRARTLNELTRASLNVLVEDLDSQRVELHTTTPVWLLARTTAVIEVADPMTGTMTDYSAYLGAYVTPNAPRVMDFLASVRLQHASGFLEGYQSEDDPDRVTSQVQAVFNALKTAGIGYVNSVIAFSPEEGSSSQRVRLPEESLERGAANCIDGVVLVASLLEAISLSPAIVIVPGHALVAWETGKDSAEWAYLETTRIGNQTFQEACADAENTVQAWKPLADTTGNASYFQLHPLHELRAIRGIFPMQ